MRYLISASLDFHAERNVPLTVRLSIKKLLCLFLAAALALACCGCAAKESAEHNGVRVVASTYPLYALASAVSAGADGVDVSRLNTGEVSCLHDYTLTVSDMRRLEQADLLLLNGAGLEEFLDEVVDQLDADIIADCSTVVDLLESDGGHHHEDHGHEEHSHNHEHDPHYWMDPRNAAQATRFIAERLSVTDPENAELYAENAAVVSDALNAAYDSWRGQLDGLSCPYLITFHDGFQYFADAFGLELLFAMEEEDGATASARDILTASQLVREYSLPAVFTEQNGSGAAARAVSGETGVHVDTLSMLMDGPDAPEGSADAVLRATYLALMGENITTLAEVLK